MTMNLNVVIRCSIDRQRYLIIPRISENTSCAGLQSWQKVLGQMKFIIIRIQNNFSGSLLIYIKIIELERKFRNE